MSKKEEKDPKAEKAAKAEKAPLTPEEEAAKGKKKKLILFAAVGLIVIGGGAGGAFMFLGKGAKKADANVEGAAGADEEEGSPGADPHAAPKKDAHADTAKDPHAEPKKDAHGEPAKDSHGEAKKDAHGEPAKDAHGEAKKDAHGEVKKDAHGEPIKDAAGSGAGADGKSGSVYTGDFGQIKEFKPFHLNLGNPLENRYVRLTIGVEYKGGQEQLLELDRREPQLRDAIVSIVSRKTREHLLSPDGKDQMRLEIKNKMNQHLDKKIENIFITDILIE